MNAYWINFVKTGNPNGDGLPEWKSYESGTGNIMEFNEGAELKAGMFKAEFEVLGKKFKEEACITYLFSAGAILKLSN
jgi:carboxylesterase type B